MQHKLTYLWNRNRFTAIETDLWLLWASGGERGHEELFQAEGIVLYVDCGGGYMTIQWQMNLTAPKLYPDLKDTFKIQRYMCVHCIVGEVRDTLSGG